MHFSLSHSGDVALLALAGVPVGVDVEAVPEPQAVTDLLAVLHPREADELRSLREAQRPDALARVWSRKEAYLKGTGEGLAFGFAHPYVGSAPEPAQLPGWRLRDAACPPGYAAALCVSTG
ncbi:4'-phosphopantetheinyl transferase superfamily protein [Streptomyces sp. NPDC005890]|uniref:4'-phosphopantetheinyl transferase family protein n=1 Tax=Streptomyces sp. NPDC005890 TaxID=3154568 RepID=UPI0033E53F7A